MLCYDIFSGGRKEKRLSKVEVEKELKKEGRKPPHEENQTGDKSSGRAMPRHRILRQPTLHLGVVLEGLVWCAGKVEVEPRHPPVVAADDQVVP